MNNLEQKTNLDNDLLTQANKPESQKKSQARALLVAPSLKTSKKKNKYKNRKIIINHT